MAKKKQQSEKPIVDDAEKQKQLELQRQIEEQKLLEEKEKIEKEKQSVLDSIVEQTEARTPQQQKAKNLEDEALKIQLIGGGTTSIKEEKDKIAQYRQPYIPYFSPDRNSFYKDTYRIKAWPEDYKKYLKPKAMADITTNLIYGRFNKEVLPRLKEKNPFIAYLIRKYKLFQFLTPEAQKEMEGFISDYTQMIANYDNWDLFEREYFKKCVSRKLSNFKLTIWTSNHLILKYSKNKLRHD